jgi:hypothetical protein
MLASNTSSKAVCKRLQAETPLHSASASGPEMCWFLDAGNKEAPQAQLTGVVGRRLGSGRDGDLMPAPMSIMGGRQDDALHICTYARSGERRTDGSDR